jgi:CHAT domain-containing protein
LESYLSLLGRIYKKSPSNSQVAFAAVEAFRIADALRGRSAQQAINASMARAAAGVLELAGLVRREQDTKKRIGALTRLYVNVLSRAIGDQDATHLETLRRLIKSLRGEHQKLRDNISLHFPNYEELMRPALPSFEKARAMLRTSEALLATYVGERETYVWAVPHKGDLEFSVVSASRAEIQELVLRLRRGIEPKGDTLDAVPQFDLDAAHRLFSMLLRVVAKGWKNAKDLLVVADGPLGQVPFSALVTESTSIKGSTSIPFADYRNVPWLAKNYGVTMLPTVSALLSLRRPAYQNPNRHSFVGFADPLFSWEHVEKAAQSTRKRQIVSMQGGETGPAGQFVLRAKPKGIADGGGRLAKLPRLPETAVEVRMIAEVLNADPRKDAITGLNANEHRVKNMDLAQYKVVAFASHALSAGDIHGLFQPAIALTAPDLLGLKEDGLLTMSEILQLKLDADWVVLSACNTAAGSGKGSETVSGLGRAFFYAGARALLVSQWNVETTSARSLVTDLFRRYASDSRLSRAQALRKAMLALIDGAGHRGSNGRMVFSYAHPLFWAAFTLYGSEA